MNALTQCAEWFGGESTILNTACMVWISCRDETLFPALLYYKVENNNEIYDTHYASGIVLS